MPPTTVGDRSLRDYAAGKAPTNCKGWPFRNQLKRPFTFSVPPGKIGSAETLTIARVLEQVAASAAFEGAQNSVMLPVIPVMVKWSVLGLRP